MNQAFLHYTFKVLMIPSLSVSSLLNFDFLSTPKFVTYVRFLRQYWVFFCSKGMLQIEIVSIQQPKLLSHLSFIHADIETQKGGMPCHLSEHCSSIMDSSFLFFIFGDFYLYTPVLLYIPRALVSLS